MLIRFHRHCMREACRGGTYEVPIQSQLIRSMSVYHNLHQIINGNVFHLKTILENCLTARETQIQSSYMAYSNRLFQQSMISINNHQSCYYRFLLRRFLISQSSRELQCTSAAHIALKKFIKSPIVIVLFYLVDTVLGAEVAGGQIGGHRQLLLIRDDSAIPQQRQPCRTHCE